MTEYIKREDAISHPFANGHYDKVNANRDFIRGHESYKEWLEDLPAADVRENVSARWIGMDSDSERYDDIRCSNCGRIYTVDAYHWCDKGRPRFSNRSGHAYTPQRTTEYENKVRLYYSRETRCTKLHGEIRADIRAYFRIPKSTPKKKAAELAEERTGCTKAPDVDNIAKIILDSLQGLAFENDKDVTYMTVGKLYGAEPRVEVTLTEVEG